MHPRWDEQCRDTMMTVPPQLTSSSFLLSPTPLAFVIHPRPQVEIQCRATIGFGHWFWCVKPFGCCNEVFAQFLQSSYCFVCPLILCYSCPLFVCYVDLAEAFGVWFGFVGKTYLNEKARSLFLASTYNSNFSSLVSCSIRRSNSTVSAKTDCNMPMFSRFAQTFMSSMNVVAWTWGDVLLRCAIKTQKKTLTIWIDKVQPWSVEDPWINLFSQAFANFIIPTWLESKLWMATPIGGGKPNEFRADTATAEIIRSKHFTLSRRTNNGSVWKSLRSKDSWASDSHVSFRDPPIMLDGKSRNIQRIDSMARSQLISNRINTGRNTNTLHVFRGFNVCPFPDSRKWANVENQWPLACFFCQKHCHSNTNPSNRR